MNWIFLFLAAFIVSSLISYFISNKFNSEKKIRSGGVAIISSFVIVTLLVPNLVITYQIGAIIFGSFAILLFGLWDDRRNVSWVYQIVFQLFLGLVLVFSGFEISQISFAQQELIRLDYWSLSLLGDSFLVLSSLFIVFWLIGIINAVNWLDGSDGLLSVSGILALLAVFFVSLRPEVDQPALAILSLVGIGSLSGFLIFNFPPAKIEAGTSGSYFVGFLLASMAIVAGTKIATTMVILILPVTDFCWVVVGRLKDGQSIFERDNKKRHLHYRLLKRGHSPRKIIFGYLIFLGTALFLSFFVVSQFQKIFLLSIELVVIIVFMVNLSKENILKNMNMKIKEVFANPIFIIILISLAVIVFTFLQKINSRFMLDPDVQIEIMEKGYLSVSIAQTPEGVYRGLSGVDYLASRTGMLFFYNQESLCTHVMRDMKIDLDFVFLKDNEVVSIQEKIPQEFEGVIQSQVGCNQVLEIESGGVERIGIEVGDQLKIIGGKN